MPFFKHNGGKIYYSAIGEGEPLLFIHGFGLDSRMWEPQIEQLSQRHQVIIYDLRGFGKSSLPKVEYSHTEDLHALLKHIGISKTKVVGHSFGGGIAIQFTLQYPEIVTGLILISSSLSGYATENTTWEELRELGRKGKVTEIKERLLVHPMVQQFKEKPELQDLVKRMLSDYSCWHFLNKDPIRSERGNSIKRLNQIKIPVSIVLGENDDKAQRDIVKIFDTKIPESTLYIIKDAGHMVNLEKPSRVNTIISGSD
jgi:pimeloyl-ACP methyl ester carboxylesterase